MYYSKNFVLQLLFSTVLCLAFFGCGKKGLPVPPHHIQPPAINDLAASIDSDTLKLIWTIPGGEKMTEGLLGFTVYRSKVPVSESDCKDCPLLFKPVSDISVETKTFQGSGNRESRYHETLEKGYKYVYKVVSYTKWDRSADSNHAEFIY